MKQEPLIRKCASCGTHTNTRAVLCARCYEREEREAIEEHGGG